MDPYNLAICFGPTLVPVPEDKDQVQYQNLVNELIKNIIINAEDIFPNDGGVVYERYISREPDEGYRLPVKPLTSTFFKALFYCLARLARRRPTPCRRKSIQRSTHPKTVTYFLSNHICTNFFVVAVVVSVALIRVSFDFSIRFRVS